MDLQGLHLIKGIQTAGIHAGIKKDAGRNDLGLIYFPDKVTMAGIFTLNKVTAWPVQYDRERLNESQSFQAILVNSGNANACNGVQGQEAMQTIIKNLAQELDIDAADILVSSTGLIGASFDDQVVVDALPDLVGNLQEESSHAFADAIMTTDTVSKVVEKTIQIGGQDIHFAGVAKGAGMIHPRMGTMLSYLVTDAQISADPLQDMLQKAVDASFNRITVDGDRSTNDTVLLAATGEKEIELSPDQFDELQGAITDLCMQLAHMIVKDGEGATKFITIQVEGAEDDDAAHTVAEAIAHSNLVKTAMFGQDPNFGRIIAAIGYSGVEGVDPRTIDIQFASAYGSQTVCIEGQAIEFPLEETRKILEEDEIEVKVQLHQGDGQMTIWTSDLSYDYVEINAEYEA